jgi:hypothetical protein
MLDIADSLRLPIYDGYQVGQVHLLIADATVGREMARIKRLGQQISLPCYKIMGLVEENTSPARFLPEASLGRMSLTSHQMHNYFSKTIFLVALKSPA